MSGMTGGLHLILTPAPQSLYLCISHPRVWQQRYWAGWEHYRPGGPVFLLIGGEGEETPGWLRAGALSDYAQQFNGRQSSDGVLVQKRRRGVGLLICNLNLLFGC